MKMTSSTKLLLAFLIVLLLGFGGGQNGRSCDGAERQSGRTE